LVDTHGSGPCGSNALGVRVPSSVQEINSINLVSKLCSGFGNRRDHAGSIRYRRSVMVVRKSLAYRES
jgi:hypothetical protein